MATLRDKAMIVDLAISRWTARKHDKTVSKEVAAMHAADPSADSDSIGRYNKVLIARKALSDISKITSRARNTHYDLTLPWNDQGERLLPAKLFIEYTDAMAVYSDEFDAARDAFIEQYPKLVEAARDRLNGLFNADDYPAVYELNDRFSFAIRTMPIPDASDFRVDLDAKNLERIRAEIESRMDERFESAMADAWRRVFEAVEKVRDRMRDFDPDKKGKLHDSVIKNLKSLVEILPALNVTDDPALERARAAMERDLCGINIGALRTDPKARKKTQATADSLLDAFNSVRA